MNSTEINRNRHCQCWLVGKKCRQIMEGHNLPLFTMIPQNCTGAENSACTIIYIRAVVGGSMILFLDNNVWRINDCWWINWMKTWLYRSKFPAAKTCKCANDGSCCVSISFATQVVFGLACTRAHGGGAAPAGVCSARPSCQHTLLY